MTPKPQKKTKDIKEILRERTVDDQLALANDLIKDCLLQYGYTFWKGRTAYLGSGGLSVLEDCLSHLDLTDPTPIRTLITDKKTLKWYTNHIPKKRYNL